MMLERGRWFHNRTLLVRVSPLRLSQLLDAFPSLERQTTGCDILTVRMLEFELHWTVVYGQDPVIEEVYHVQPKSSVESCNLKSLEVVDSLGNTSSPHCLILAVGL